MTCIGCGVLTSKIHTVCLNCTKDHFAIKTLAVRTRNPRLHFQMQDRVVSLTLHLQAGGLYENHHSQWTWYHPRWCPSVVVGPLSMSPVNGNRVNGTHTRPDLLGNEGVHTVQGYIQYVA
jgi:hypothetical protein